MTTRRYRPAGRPTTWPDRIERDHEPLYEGGGSRPVPDPTALTTEQTDRAIAAVREIFGAQLEGLQNVFETRLDGMDEAIKLLQTILDRVPNQMDTKVIHLGDVVSETFKVHQEKFLGVDKQFAERDTRSERESRDNKVAVDAAFAAQKEAASEQNKSNTLAIDKSERATAETLNKQADLFKSTTDALSSQISTSASALSDNIVDLKERMTRVESQVVSASNALATALATTTQAKSERNSEQTIRQGSNSYALAIAGFVGGTLVGVAGIVLAIVK